MKPPGKLALIKDSWSISAIVLWEISELSAFGRSEIDLEHPELVRTLARIQTGSLTLEVCRTIQTLDFKGDSADEIIGSTSIVQRVSLVTRDRRIRRSSAFPSSFDVHTALLSVCFKRETR